MKMIIISLFAIAAISTTAMAEGDKSTDHFSGGAGYRQQVVPVSGAPVGIWGKTETGSQRPPVDNDIEHDKSVD